MHIARQSTYVERPAWSRVRLSYQALPAIAVAFDLALVVSASVLGQRCYQYFAFGAFGPRDDLISLGLISASLFCLLARVASLYRLPVLLAPLRYQARVVATLAVSQLAVICILFLLKDGAEYSRGAMIVFTAFAAGLLPFGRLVVAAASRAGARRGVFAGRRVVALGDPAELARLGEADYQRFGIEHIARIAIGVSPNGAGLSEADRTRIDHANFTPRNSPCSCRGAAIERWPKSALCCAVRRCRFVCTPIRRSATSFAIRRNGASINASPSPSSARR